MFVSLFRVIKFAFQDFFRNFWLSFVTLTILFLALSAVHVLIILNTLADTAIAQVEQKIDVTVYFNNAVREEQIFNVQNYLEAMPEVKEVTYVSKDDALAQFRAKHQGNEKILETLEELEDNPLGATLIISAQTTEAYQTILEALEGQQYANLIEDKDFDDHRLVVDKIMTVTNRVSFAVMILAIVFGLISILIVFNSIRIAIYTHRDEIRMMALVGATNSFIVAPYIVQGLLFALFAVVVSMVVMYPFLGVMQPYIATFFEDGGGFNIVEYYNMNFPMIFGLMFAGAALINIFAALLATNKYLKY